MMKSHVYSVTPDRLAARYGEIVAACRAQGIGELTMLSSVTGKLTGSLELQRELRGRLEKDGIRASAMIFSIGHPQMAKFYGEDGTVTAETWYDGPLVFEGQAAGEGAVVVGRRNLDLLPVGWQYAVNEFGQNVYGAACPNAAWREGNLWVIRQLATVFDEIWYDDEYRVDSDQFAGVRNKSTASCYCRACLEGTGKRLGRKVEIADVVGEQAVHEAWIAHKVAGLTAAWNDLVDAGRAVNAKLDVGIMIRWGGEERDGLDAPALVKKMDRQLLLRLGEGHFGVPAYSVPANQVIEYLVSTYHVSWFPKAAVVKSETTYFAPLDRPWVVKKAALSLAAGARQLSYCPCVPEWVEHQGYMAEEREKLDSWGDALGDKAALWGDVQIVRGKAAAIGDRRPMQRARDRQAFPLFGLAGLCSSVVRVGSWRHDRKAPVAAVTGRAVWDYPQLEWSGHDYVVVDGAALLEESPVNAALGISKVKQEGDGRVTFAGWAWAADGKLWRKANIIVLPVVWQDIPPAQLAGWLEEIRRVIGAVVPGVVVEGALEVMPIQYRQADRDVVMLVNLAREERKVHLRLRGERTRVTELDGPGNGLEWELGPDGIRVLEIR